MTVHTLAVADFHSRCRPARAAAGKGRKPSGSSLAEAGAALSLMLPLAVLVCFVVLEASYAYLIKESLSQASRRAARDLAVAYGENPGVASSRSLQDTMVFNNIRLTNIVNASAQFDDPVFNSGADPPTVSVTVRYLSKQFGLPPFPNPDPLNLGQAFAISSSCTYRLE